MTCLGLLLWCFGFSLWESKSNISFIQRWAEKCCLKIHFLKPISNAHNHCTALSFCIVLFVFCQTAVTQTQTCDSWELVGITVCVRSELHFERAGANKSEWNELFCATEERFSPCGNVLTWGFFFSRCFPAPREYIWRALARGWFVRRGCILQI